MKLAEKIIEQRKKHGWSQEDLADKCGVSRQAVSKWETGESIPDLDKIICMSDLFGVCTDYLLKDKTEVSANILNNSNENTSKKVNENVRVVSKEQAFEYMNIVENISSKMSIGVIMCILSPIMLITLPALSEIGSIALSNAASFIISFVYLFFMVSCGVSLLISNGLKQSKYDFLDHEVISLDEEIKEIVRQKRIDFSPIFRRKLLIGVILCISSALPVLIASVLFKESAYTTLSVDVLLIIVACGVYCFISSGTIDSSYKKLLQEDDFSVEEKKNHNVLAPFSGIYWMIIVAIYLTKSFKTGEWGNTWLIWPIAALVFGILQAILGAIFNKKNK